jgi:UDP-glucose 4-epimerase
VGEDHSPLLPISTYGASKLACEALISSYTHLFGLQGYVFRFANVIGPRQTHGVAYDFIRKLQRDPRRLEILGDGTQSKSYIHVSEIVGAIEHVVAAVAAPYNYYNVATDDYLDVTTIAQLVMEAMGLGDVALSYTGGPRGWKGDVPVVRFDLKKIHALGWRARLTSREAMQQAIRALLADLARTDGA